jgi:hypothetical protein
MREERGEKAEERREATLYRGRTALMLLVAGEANHCEVRLSGKLALALGSADPLENTCRYFTNMYGS